MSAVAAAQIVSGGIYLRACLAPFAEALERPDVTDIYVNRPGEVWIEYIGGALEQLRDAALDAPTLERLARQLAALTHQGISREHPLLSATLPDGARVQIVAPPATRGPLALAIRKHVAPAITLGDYQAGGLFTNTTARSMRSVCSDDQRIRELVSDKNYSEALAAAVRARKNILVSGGTSTGKTTFLNALLREVAPDERLILIEDTPELTVGQHNYIGLIAVRGGLGEAQVTANDLVAASLRMRPDRIILGELRGTEAFAFLRAINSGHPGSMTTIHADSPETAIEQLVLLVLQAGTRLNPADVRHYVSQTVDVFVHLSRTGGQRTVESIVLRDV